MNNFFMDLIRTTLPNSIARDISAAQPLDVDGTITELVHMVQREEMRNKIFREYPGIVEAKDSFESNQLRDAITLIAEGDFEQVSNGVSTLKTCQIDKLMENWGLPILSEQDKFTLAMLKGEV